MARRISCFRWHIGLTSAMVIVAAGVVGQDPAKPAAKPAAKPVAKPVAKRVAPPKFDAAEVSQVFFPDVFTKLQGDRPATANASVAAAGGSAPAAVPGNSPTAAGGQGGWSKLISSATIEDEIKAIKLEVDKNVSTSSDFAGRGHKVIRREFSILAMLFAVVAEYEGDVRFKKEAATARDLFSRTANNTKAGGNTNVFNEAKLRKADLDDLLSGSALASQSSGEVVEWGLIIDRSPMMQRLENLFQEKVNKSLASKDEFAKNNEEILHHAEIISVMGTVLTKPGMSDADDEAYAGFAKSMQAAAGEIVDAVKLNNYDQARAAAGKIDKACSQCHEGYR